MSAGSNAGDFRRWRWKFTSPGKSCNANFDYVKGGEVVLADPSWLRNSDKQLLHAAMPAPLFRRLLLR
jgi:hypothetical protein